jgi:transcriptional regulator with XRE-family HTH domain
VQAHEVNEEETVKRITKERLAHGWTKTELGRRARLHPARVGTIENGRVVPYEVELRRLARALRWPGEAAALVDEVGEDADDE